MRFLTAVLLVCLPALALAGWTVSDFSATIMMDINMVSDKVGFIAGAENGSGAFAVKTTDGGNTWEQQTIGNAFMLMAAAAQSETSAIIAGVSILSGSIEYTTDGAHFTNASEPHVAMEQVQSAYTIGGSFGEGYAVVGDWQIFGENNTYNGISVSANGGASWSIIDTQNPVPARYGAFPTPSTFFLTFGTWPNTSHTVGRPITRNIHYHTFGFNNVSQHHVHKHKPATPNDEGAWIAQIMRSTDGGASWDLVFSNDTFYFNQIACPSESVCFAVGENDEVAYGFRSTDGGNTWDQILEVEGVSLMAVEALSETEIWIGGGVLAFPVVGHTYHSTDGGNTFTAATVADNYFSAFSFPDPQHGFAVSIDTEQQSGVLIYTA